MGLQTKGELLTIQILLLNLQVHEKRDPTSQARYKNCPRECSQPVWMDGEVADMLSESRGGADQTISSHHLQLQALGRRVVFHQGVPLSCQALAECFVIGAVLVGKPVQYCLTCLQNSKRKSHPSRVVRKLAWRPLDRDQEAGSENDDQEQESFNNSRYGPAYYHAVLGLLSHALGRFEGLGW